MAKGNFSPRDPIRNSGLWNINYVEVSYNPQFLKTFADYVDITLNCRVPPKKSIAPRDWFLAANRKSDKHQLLLFSKE